MPKHTSALLLAMPLLFCACSSPQNPDVTIPKNATGTAPDNTGSISGTSPPSTPTTPSTPSTPTSSPTTPSTPSNPTTPSTPTPPMYTPGGPCNGLDYAGVCQGTAAVWCENGVVQTEDCASEGTTCGLCPGGNAICGAGGSSGGSSGGSPDGGTPPTPPGGAVCGSITNNGVCQGSTLAYCSDQSQSLVNVDCSQHGGCVVDSTGWADCAQH